MSKELLAHFPLINLVLFGQLLFFAIFLCALLWVFRRGSKDLYKHLADLPNESVSAQPINEKGGSGERA